MMKGTHSALVLVFCHRNPWPVLSSGPGKLRVLQRVSPFFGIAVEFFVTLIVKGHYPSADTIMLSDGPRTAGLGVVMWSLIGSVW